MKKKKPKTNCLNVMEFSDVVEWTKQGNARTRTVLQTK